MPTIQLSFYLDEDLYRKLEGIRKKHSPQRTLSQLIAYIIARWLKLWGYR